MIAYFIAAIFLKTHDSPFNRESWIKDYAVKHDVDIEIKVKGETVKSPEDLDEKLKDLEEVEEKDEEKEE